MKMKKILFFLLLLTLLLPVLACNSAEKHDVVYMVDGVQYSKLTTSGNRVFPLPPEPTKAGYVFKGWYYDADYYLEPFDNTAWENAPLLTNITVYAKWKRDGACPEGECIPGEITVVKESTCTERGIEQAVCIECEETISRYLPLIDHVADEETHMDNEIAATCAKEGSYDIVTVCRECGTELHRETKTTEKLDHIPKAAVWERIQDATCTEEGSYESVVYCRDCNAELSREECTIEKKTHTTNSNVCEMCQVDYLTYEFSEALDGYIVTGAAQNNYSTIVIPSKYNGKAVRAIGAGAFSGFTNLKKIEIPFNINRIEENAFLGCTALTSITYHGKLKEWELITVAAGNEPLTAITPYCTNNFTDWMPF